MKTKNTPISSKENGKDLAEVIKLGLDIHASKYAVARQVDEAPPQSAQSFDLDKTTLKINPSHTPNGGTL